MATLQKIRNHGVFLIVIVGLAMLAFILGDALNSGSSFFNRSREYVGEIAGHKVHYTEYEAAKDQLTEVYKIETGRSDMDEDMSSQIRNQVWQMMLMDWSLRAEAEKIGMDITAEELSELCIGENPHQIIRQRRAFFDETGQFSREGLVRFLSSIEQESENPEQEANLKQAKSYWLYWENAVRLTYMQDKFSALLQNLCTANKLDAKYAAMARTNSRDVQYVFQSYYDIADSLVNIKQADIKKLYAERKAMYKQTPNRGIEYIVFEVVPSEQDFQEAENMMKSLQEEFNTTDDIALVVNPNSDVTYNDVSLSADMVPEMYREFAFHKGAKVGDVTDINFTDNTYSMARIMACGYNRPDSVCLKAVATEAGQEDTELGWFTEVELHKQIAEPAFAGKRGTRFTINLGMGDQTLEVIDIAPATPKVKLAILERKVTPSSKTYNTIYNRAKQFIVANAGEEQFRNAAKEAGMTLHPAFNMDRNAEKIAELKNSRPIVRWAFEAEAGQISDVFECGDKFVVALLSDVKDGNYRPMSEVQGELAILARNAKKADIIINNLKGYTTLNEAAEKLHTNVQTAEKISMSSYRFGTGVESAVIGTAMALDDNELSQPVKGNAGVFVLQAGPMAVAENATETDVEIQQLNMRLGYMLPYQAVNMLQQSAEVVDNRSNFQ